MTDLIGMTLGTASVKASTKVPRSRSHVSKKPESSLAREPHFVGQLLPALFRHGDEIFDDLGLRIDFRASLKKVRETEHVRFSEFHPSERTPLVYTPFNLGLKSGFFHCSEASCSVSFGIWRRGHDMMRLCLFYIVGKVPLLEHRYFSARCIE